MLDMLPTVSNILSLQILNALDVMLTSHDNVLVLLLFRVWTVRILRVLCFYVKINFMFLCESKDSVFIVLVVSLALHIANDLLAADDTPWRVLAIVEYLHRRADLVLPTIRKIAAEFFHKNIDFLASGILLLNIDFKRARF